MSENLDESKTRATKEKEEDNIEQSGDAYEVMSDR